VGAGMECLITAARDLCNCKVCLCCCMQLSGRRLQNHGGIVHTKGLIPSSLPRWLQGLADRLHTDIPLFGDKAPNHVLINSYNPGEGIMVSAYTGWAQAAATQVSLRKHA
jgi:alkylated DNA repair protein alkB family protein 6